MSETTIEGSLRAQIRSIQPAIGRTESELLKLRSLLHRLAELNCFDGDPKFMKEFEQVILEEIKQGADRVGFFGSRAKGTQKARNSDLDVLVINPLVGKTLPNGQKLEPAAMVGSLKYWGSKGEIGMVIKQRIHIQRHPNNNPSDRIEKKLVRDAVWVWKKEQEAPKTVKRDFKF